MVMNNSVSVENEIAHIQRLKTASMGTASIIKIAASTSVRFWP
jgi:hypothetical protein